MASQLNRPQIGKNVKSSDKHSSSKNATTYLQTPPRHLQTKTKTEQQQQAQPTPKHCPYHFSQPTHICLTCRRSICLRCAITYCQQHTIHPEPEILPLLLTDLQKLTIEPRIEDLELRLKQSEQKQEYIKRKVEKMLRQVQENFGYVIEVLERKKEQILAYFREEFWERYESEYRRYDDELAQKIDWLKGVLQDASGYGKIEDLDRLAGLIKREVPTKENMNKTQLKINKLIAGKQKLKMSSIWSQQKLENILYQIQHISYRLKENPTGTAGNSSQSNTGGKKKRIITQISDSNNRYEKDRERDRVVQFTANFNSNSNNNSNSKNPFAGLVSSGSNSRFSTGRKMEH